jgi:hypothetical protein
MPSVFSTDIKRNALLDSVDLADSPIMIGVLRVDRGHQEFSLPGNDIVIFARQSVCFGHNHLRRALRGPLCTVQLYSGTFSYQAGFLRTHSGFPVR